MERNVSVRLGAKVDSYIAGMRAASAATTGFSRSTERNLARVGGQLQNVGRRMTTWVSLPIVAAGAAAVAAAVSWESSWAGVTKTVNGTTEQLAELEQGLRDMSKEVPATHGEIAAVAEAAGQLGVAVEDIEDFTRVMIDLGETTNLTADEAATSIAQLMNVMGTAPEDVDNLGSALVALGNDGASTERDIVQMAQRIAGAANIVGMSEAEVLGFANALASAGIEVEAGGSAMSRVITDMGKAVMQGGKELDIFAQVAGVSAASFATSFREDPAAAIVMFIDGLANLHAAGGDVFTALDEMGLSGIRVQQSILGLLGSSDKLTGSLELGAEAWADNTALTFEAAKRYETTAAKFEFVRNKIVDLFIDLGEIILPVVEKVVDVIGVLAEKFQSLPQPLQMAVGGFLGLVAAMGPTVFIAGSLIKNWTTLTAHMTRFGPAASTAAKALGAIGIAAGVGFLAYQAFTGEQRKTDEVTRDVSGALVGQMAALFSVAGAATEAGTGINGVAVANEALALSLSEGHDELADSLANLNVGASETLDILVMYGQDPVRALAELAHSYGLTQGQAQLFARAISGADTELEKFAAARELAEGLRLSTDQFEQLTIRVLGFERAIDNVDLDEIAETFLRGRVRALGFEESLVAAAEAELGFTRETGSAFLVLMEWSRQVAIADQETRDAVTGTDEYGAAMAALPPELQALIEGTEGAAGGIGELETVAANTIDTMSDLADSWAFADVRMNAFSEGLERALGTGGQWIRAHDSFQASLIGFNDELDHSTHSLDWNTEAGLANRSAVMDLADELVAMTESNIASGMSQSEVTADYIKGREALLDAAEAAGLNRGEVEDLIDAYGAVPELVSTAVQLMGHALAEWRIQRYLEKLDKIDPVIATEIEALIDKGMYDEAIALLNSIPDQDVGINVRVRNPVIRLYDGGATLKVGNVTAQASASGRFVRGGTNMLSTLGERGGAGGDEVVLPLGDPGRMAALLGMSEVGPRVAAALGNLMPAPAGAWSSPSSAVSEGDTIHVTVNNNGREITRHDIASAIRQAKAGR